MASDERCRRQIEDQAAIHLLVEVEIEVLEAHLRIAKLCLFPAPFQKSVAAASQFVRHQTGEEVDGCHRFRLGLLQACFQHRGHTTEAQLTQSTIQLDEIHSGCSLVLRLMKSRYSVSWRISGSICRKNICGCGRQIDPLIRQLTEYRDFI